MSSLFAFLLSGINVGLHFVFRALIVKFVIFFALWYVTTEFVQVLTSAGVLPNPNSLSGAFVNLPSSAWYWLDLLAIPQGLPLVLAAMANRFIIRRIPMLG
ncbi:hypothetical protein PAN31117_04831 [Pandoraea anapnoica]|uniref:Phage-related membrane protein n=1 Tax=Pandoraea anapnoica TaxID=2508301 RepID=A0A5E5API8_9BURK|nr:DUF2523 family protein [Pandoraea anapnoica]VVE74030.1 hypothetical protein PAN31117_04831 [Pandoraea anapnoica]